MPTRRLAIGTVGTGIKSTDSLRMTLTTKIGSKLGLFLGASLGFGKVASPLSFGCAFGIRSGKEFLFEEKGLLPKMLPKWLTKESYQKCSEACSQISSEIGLRSQIQLIKFLNDENLSLLPQATHFERSRKHSQKKGFFW